MRKLIKLASAALLVAGLSACGQSNDAMNEAAPAEELNIAVEAGNSVAVEETANGVANESMHIAPEKPAAPADTKKPSAPPKPAPAPAKAAAEEPAAEPKAADPDCLPEHRAAGHC